MKVLFCALLAMSTLSGCISSSDPSPPAKDTTVVVPPSNKSTTVVVPQNSGTTVVCSDGSKPPC